MIREFFRSLFWSPINQYFCIRTKFSEGDFHGGEYLQKKCKEKLGYCNPVGAHIWNGVYEIKWQVDDKWHRICERDLDSHECGEKYEKFLIDEANLRGIPKLKNVAGDNKKLRLYNEAEEEIKKTDKRWLDFLARTKNNNRKSFCNSKWYRPGVLIKVKKKVYCDQEEITTLLIGHITRGDEYGSCGNPYLDDNDFIMACKEVISEEEMEQQ
jgi:hypothetical protein